jgi:hypothetical protein
MRKNQLEILAQSNNDEEDDDALALLSFSRRMFIVWLISRSPGFSFRIQGAARGFVDRSRGF